MPIYCGKGFKSSALLLSLFLINPIFASDNLIEVKIGLMETLSPMTPSSSDRYKSLNESALYYALGENEEKLHKCGYKITTTTSYFDTFDALELIADAKALEQSKAWVIIGPRRSSHFITAAKELKETPMISTLANADSIFSASKLVFTMYPSASTLAKVMANEVAKNKYGNTYGTVVDVRCDSCVDFAKAFHKHNINSKEAFYLEVADNTPNLDKLRQYISKYNIEYLLLPNYSELTGFIVSKVNKEFPSVKFIGSEGWGENSFSYINGYGINNDVVAMSIRAGVQDNDKDNHFKVYSLDSVVNGVKIKPPYSVYAIVELVRVLSDDLCHSSAKNKQEFVNYLDKQQPAHFQQKPLPFSIYKIKDGQLVFSHYVDGNEKK